MGLLIDLLGDGNSGADLVIDATEYVEGDGSTDDAVGLLRAAIAYLESHR